jgi:N-acetylglucosaminyl-diphospho-decaprenol L-rhamnosyltransferase
MRCSARKTPLPPNLPFDNVTAVVVTYNSAHCLPDLAKSLASFKHITIVDNGSQDTIDSAVRQHLPQAQLIRLLRNQGFGTANNVALKQALQGRKTPFALLLNPDCQLTDGALLQLMDTAQNHPTAAVVAPQISRPDGSLEISYRWPQGLWSSSGPAAQGVCCVGFVSGAVMLLRLSAFEDIGFFDEDFFLYYEDEDLCTRLFKAKRAMVIDPQACAVHASRSSVKEGFPWRSEYIRGFHHAQSKLIYERKHGQAQRVQALRLRVLLLALLTFPFRLLWPQPRYLVRLIGRIAGLVRYPRRPSSAA